MSAPFSEDSNCDVVADGAICLFEGRKVLLPDATPKGMIAHWNFDGDHVVDSSGNRNHAKDPIPSGPGMSGTGSSAYVNGYDYVEFDHSASFGEANEEYSLTMWVFMIQEPTTTSSKWCPIVHKGSEGSKGSPSIEINTVSRKLRFTALQSGVSGSSAEVTTNARVNIHRWSHIAVVRHKDNLEVYVNGVLDAKVAAGKPESNDKPLYVGSVPWNRNNVDCAIPMYVDEIRMYSRVLEQDEIVAESAPSLGGISPRSVNLGCSDCEAGDAKTSCASGYHICQNLELHAEGYQFASAMGYVDSRSTVWSHEDMEAGKAVGKGTVICCTDRN